MRRCADHICQVFHTEEYLDAVPGHEEIELALIKLADATGEEKYAQMAMSFVDRRGCSDYLSREHTLPALLTLSPKSGIFYSRKLCSGGTFYEKPHLSWH